ncbi:MAG: septum formation inhibitor Maf [Gracilimonas sp.]|uniref:Maf family protein n=1 Tax=Gracilimonas sp. TaxID=1974203 RepID=UPI0019BAE6B7|nr:Maf family protein [Gracilimonas sp.]MBD3615134.1 septum formation inhibitor Maf [Gracilimonas sp.]
MTRIILASQSPRRKKLLEQIGLSFEVFPSDVEENSSQQDPALLVKELALLKAREVSARFQDSLVIGADTVVVHKGKIVGKPENEEEAAEFLTSLSNSTHTVYTGVALVKSDKKGHQESGHTFFEQTKVTFSTLDKQDIHTYIKSGNPLDKAGAYGIQDDLGALFVERIEGDYYNVVGFPLNRFYRELKKIMPKLTLMALK